MTPPAGIFGASSLLALVCVSHAGFVELQLGTPDLDRWMYPFNADPGNQWYMAIFGATVEGGFSPDFDNRDGQGIVGFDTASAGIEPGLGPESYQVQSIVVFLTVKEDETFEYDPTPDPYTSWLPVDHPDFEPDPDPGRPVELFGAGFRNGWTALTFQESGPFCDGCNCFPPNSCVAVRNVYPIDFVGVCEPRDVSNNVTEAFDPAPWAVGTSDGLQPGDPVPIDTELRFEIGLADPCVRQHLAAALDEGMLDLVIASIFPAQKQQGGTFPRFYTKEDPLVELGIVSAARLDLTVRIGPPGDLDGDGIVGIGDLLMLLAGWGACLDPCPPCVADLDGDCDVGITDLLTLLANWS